MAEKKKQSPKKQDETNTIIKELDDRICKIDNTLAGIAKETIHHENILKEFKKIIYKIKHRLGIE